MATNNAINNLLFPNVTSVNSATILTADAYGTNVVCDGASAYALTLPTVTSNSNKFITISSRTTSNAIVTITPASGTIAGISTLPIGSGDSVTIMNNGTNWSVVSQFLQPVNVNAYLTPTQTIPDSVDTKVVFNNLLYDVSGFFNTSTGRFLPLLPGIYFVTLKLQYVSSAVTPLLQTLQIYVDGSPVVGYTQTLTTNFQQSMTVSSILMLNGSTNYVEGFAYQNSGGGLDLVASLSTSFNAMRISLF